MASVACFLSPSLCSCYLDLSADMCNRCAVHRPQFGSLKDFLTNKSDNFAIDEKFDRVYLRKDYVAVERTYSYCACLLCALSVLCGC